MTSSTSPRSWWTELIERDSVVQWRQNWDRRLARVTVPEVLIATFIVVVSALSATLVTQSAVIIGLAIVCGLVVHFSAVESGNYALGWMASGMVLAFSLVAAGRLFDGLSPVAYTVPSLIALVHNELLGLSYARRRSGLVSSTVHASSAIGLTAVAALSVLGIGVAQRLNSGADRSWLWMVTAAGLVMTSAVLLTWLPARNPNPGRRKRWRPGDRIPPAPIDQITVDDTVGAGPGRR